MENGRRKGKKRKNRFHLLFFSCSSKIIFTFKSGAVGDACDVRMKFSVYVLSLPHCSRRTEFDDCPIIPTLVSHGNRVRISHFLCFGSRYGRQIGKMDRRTRLWRESRTNPKRQRSDTLALPFSLNTGRFYVNVTDCLANETREYDTMRYSPVPVVLQFFFFFFFTPCHTSNDIVAISFVRRQPQNTSCYCDAVCVCVCVCVAVHCCLPQQLPTVHRKNGAPLASFRSQCDFICFLRRRRCDIIRRHTLNLRYFRGRKKW